MQKLWKDLEEEDSVAVRRGRSWEMSQLGAMKASLGSLKRETFERF